MPINETAERTRYCHEHRHHLRQQEEAADCGLAAFQTVHIASLVNKAVQHVSHLVDSQLHKFLARPPDGQSLLLRAGPVSTEELAGHATVGAALTLLAGTPYGAAGWSSWTISAPESGSARRRSRMFYTVRCDGSGEASP